MKNKTNIPAGLHKNNGIFIQYFVISQFAIFTVIGHDTINDVVLYLVFPIRKRKICFLYEHTAAGARYSDVQFNFSFPVGISRIH